MKSKNLMLVLTVLAVSLAFGLSTRPASGAWSFQRISNNSGDSLWPNVAEEGNNIHVVWFDTSYGNYEIFYKRSTDNGSTWSFQRLTTNSGESIFPDVAVRGSSVHIVWSDATFGNQTEIFYKRSTDNGSSWAFQRLTNNSGSSGEPAVAVEDSNVHVVWHDDTYGWARDIFYKRSTDNGSTWTFQRLCNTSWFGSDAEVAAAGSNVHVVWQDGSFGYYWDIFYKRSTDNGSTWSFQRLSNSGGDSYWPEITGAGPDVYVVWQDDTYASDWEILSKKSTDNGATWAFQRLTTSSGRSYSPMAAAVGNTVHLVWQDSALSGGGYYDPGEIFYKRSTDRGSTWSFARLTSNSGDSIRPAVASNGSMAHVVWCDTSFSASTEIFYKQGP